MCDLGYVPEKESITLRTLGLQFAAVLPSDDAQSTLNLRCATNVRLESCGAHSMLRTVELVVPPEIQSGRWWLEAGPGLPDGVELVEGPLVVSGNRAQASLLVSEDCHVGPGTRIGRARRATCEDFKVVATMEAAELEGGSTY